VAYSILSFQTAWLKAHHAADFMGALLSSQIGDTDSVVKYIAEARELGLEIMPPHINESGYKFTVVEDKRLRFGLGAIRNVGKSAIESILAARGERRFDSLSDLCDRVDLRLCNKRVFEALVHAGALDGLGGGHRAQFMAILDQAIQEAALKQEEIASGQGSLFGETAGGITGADARGSLTLPIIAPMSEHERLTREKESIGFYISGHPLEPFRTECELFATHDVAQLGTWSEGTMHLGVVVTAIKRQISKRSGAEFARLVIEDFSGSAEVLVFPEAWTLLADRLRPDVPVLMRGSYSRRDQGAEAPTFIVESVTRFEELRVSGQVAVAIDLGTRAGNGNGERAPLTSRVISDVRAVAEAHPGTAPLEVSWSDTTGAKARLRSRSLAVSATGAALTELRALLGDERVRLVRGKGGGT
jgi:DNA polymerase-3 subunit alpha